MFGAIAKAVFGSANDRYVRSLDKTLATIAAFEPQLEGFSDAELSAQTAKFREQLAAGKELDDILPEAFATVREASKRVLGMRHFDVQPKACPKPPRIVLVVPTVMLQADRAHE